MFALLVSLFAFLVLLFAFIFVFFHLVVLIIHTDGWNSQRIKNIASKGCDKKIKSSHRGYIENYPENTIGSIIDSYKHELIPEMDIQLTIDKQLIVFHDKNCSRMTKHQSNLKIKNSSHIELIENVLIPQNLFGIKFKTSSKISLFDEILKEVNNNIDDKTSNQGMYLDLKGHSKTIFASKWDKIFNEKLIESLSKSQLIQNKNFMFYFAGYNAGALNDLIKKWNKFINDNNVSCQYSFVFYLGAGFVFNLEYLLLKTKIWIWFCPQINAFVCDDGLFLMYYDEILKHYKSDGIQIGCWQKYHQVQNYSNADIQIHNLPSHRWQTVIKHGGFTGSKLGDDYKHKDAFFVYNICRCCVGLSWFYIFYYFVA